MPVSSAILSSLHRLGEVANLEALRRGTMSYVIITDPYVGKVFGLS